MRHGFRSIKLTTGARAAALAFALLAVPVTSQAAPALALADTGPGDARRQVDAAIVLDLGDGYTDNQAVLQKVHYRQRHNRRLPYWFYRFKQPRYSHNAPRYHYQRAPRNNYRYAPRGRNWRYGY